MFSPVSNRKPNRQSGVTIVEALIAMAILGVIIAAITSLQTVAFRQIKSDLSKGASYEVIDAVRLILSNESLCRGALQDGSGNPARLNFEPLVSNPKKFRIVPNSSNLHQIFRYTIPSSTTQAIAIIDDPLTHPFQLNEKVRVTKLELISHQAESKLESGQDLNGNPAQLLRTPVQLKIEMTLPVREAANSSAPASPPGFKKVSRSIDTQLITKPITGTTIQEIQTCYIQNLRFETVIGRISPISPFNANANPNAISNLQVNNNTSTSPPGFGSATDKGIAATEILTTITDPSKSKKVLALGCREELGWQLVNCNRYNPTSGTGLNVMVDLERDQNQLYCKTTSAEGVTLETGCMRVMP